METEKKQKITGDIRVDGAAFLSMYENCSDLKHNEI